MLSEKQVIANRNNALKSTGPKSFEGKRIASQNAFKHGFRASGMPVRSQESPEFTRFRAELLVQLSPVGFIESRLADQVAAALWKLQRLGRIEPELLEVINSRHLELVAEDEQQALAVEKERQDAQAKHHREYGFDQAKQLWLDTPDGRLYQSGCWPTGPGARSYIRSFDTFWAELECQAIEAKQKAQLAAPAVPELPRTDLSYQVMMESQVARTAAQAAAQLPASPLPLSSEDAASSDNVEPAEELSLAPAMLEDFAGSNVLLKFSRYQTQAERSFYRALNELNKLQFIRRQSQAIEAPLSGETGKEGLCEK